MQQCVYCGCIRPGGQNFCTRLYPWIQLKLEWKSDSKHSCVILNPAAPFPTSQWLEKSSWVKCGYTKVVTVLIQMLTEHLFHTGAQLYPIQTTAAAARWAARSSRVLVQPGRTPYPQEPLHSQSGTPEPSQCFLSIFHSGELVCVSVSVWEAMVFTPRWLEGKPGLESGVFYCALQDPPPPTPVSY